ncbi:hypothetical protein WJX72_010178 [[Myrmecia] bisecta]|uniref:Uncharacterized protein n=1 Tax=[Myrmecia] bisecta TaxID=41462 RepID=A0AAW1Q853_9CHLO
MHTERCQREAAAFRKALSCGLPAVDWTRYHLQLLFVDRTDTVRARIAVGLFDKLAEWNGYGRALYATPCGVDPSSSSGSDGISTTVALMRRAETLGLSPKLFAKAKDSFVREDLDRFDLLIAVDTSVRDDILASAGPAAEDCAYYAPRVALLTDFAAYCGDDILRTGGTAVLDPDFGGMTPLLADAARQVRDIHSPLLSEGDKEWAPMINTMVVSCAGLVQYLIDAYPPDLQHYDPV